MQAYNVLVVDDEAEIQDAIEIYLRHEHMNVYKAGNGLEALELIGREDIHLIILDIMMPELDGILDRKSQRLKVLINDLFEASKMASGAVELTLEDVNVSALLGQALAEYSDKIEAAPLTFRVLIAHPHIRTRLDGKKTWRVLENLLSNALKYSLPGSRVYVALTEDDNHVVLTINNISAYEIDFEVEELFERFKRGDASRHTEGSGLGLAIARSIVELQEGRLQIEIDGDCFKATVTWPKNASTAGAASGSDHCAGTTAAALL
nr:ATP-binding protein [Paenibacillus konkukensis]